MNFNSDPNKASSKSHFLLKIMAHLFLVCNNAVSKSEMHLDPKMTIEDSYQTVPTNTYNHRPLTQTSKLATKSRKIFIKLLLDLTVMKVIRLQQKMKLGQSKVNKTQAPYAVI